MSKKERNIKPDFYNKVARLLKEAQKSVVQSVNKTMVYTYFEIGRIIVEEEQKGKVRAEYGKQLIKELSQRINKRIWKRLFNDKSQTNAAFLPDVFKKSDTV